MHQLIYPRHVENFSYRWTCMYNASIVPITRAPSGSSPGPHIYGCSGVWISFGFAGRFSLASSSTLPLPSLCLRTRCSI